MAIPAFVQSNTLNLPTGTYTTASQSYAIPQGVGNCNLVCISINGVGVSVVGITDTALNTYTRVCTVPGAGNWISQIWVSFNIQSVSGNVVKAAFGSNTSAVSMVILEYSGGTSIAAVDTFKISTGTGTSVSSGTITPLYANELLLSYVMSNTSGTAMSAGSGWTFRATTGRSDGVEDQIYPLTSPISGTFTAAASVAWSCAVVSLLPQAPSSPISSPSGGHYDYPTVVTMSSSTPGATVHYTLDGSTPTTGSPVYSSPVTIGTTSVLNMVATAAGQANSPMVSSLFYIQPGGFWNTTDDSFDLTTGARINQLGGSILYDPVSGLWYKYGGRDDHLAAGPTYIYKSSDFLNWTSLGVSSPSYFGVRPNVIYNAANNNYVLWSNLNGVNNSKASYVSSSPSGPFTIANTYDTWAGINIDLGDCSAWVDPNTGVGYFLTVCNNKADFMVIQLSSDFKSLTNTLTHWTGTGFEAPSMWSNGINSYFLQFSGQTSWAPNANLYQWANSPMAPQSNWSPATNPFQAASISQTPGETAAGITPSTVNSYDTQTGQVVRIPGRNGFIYFGDRYDGVAPPFPNYRRILLPGSFPTTSSWSISWQPTWNLNDTFSTTSGAPTPATNLVLNSGTFSWTNTWTLGSSIYLDFATTSVPSTVVRSEVVSVNSSPVSSYTPRIPVGAGFYFIRTVNANGESASVPFSISNAPAVTVGVASSVTSTAAVVSGNVTSIGGGSVTARGFNYGLTSSYGLIANASGSFGTGVYSLPLSGLTPGQIYHFQAFATNANGTSVSSDQAFITGGTTPTVTVQNPTAVNANSATLNGTITALGTSDATAAGFNYGTDATYGFQVITSGDFGTGSFSGGISGLTASTTYHFRSFATNLSGTSVSGDSTFKTSTLIGTLGRPVSGFPIEASDIGTSLTLGAASLLDYCNPAIKQDQAFVAICKALDPQLQSFVNAIPNCIIFSNLSNQPEFVLDFIALYHFNVDYYDTMLPIATKLLLVKNVIQDKISKGTPSRIINLMNQVFAFGELVEWFNDTPPGIPNTFRIQIADPLTDPVKVANLVRAILVAKNVRSYFAGISSFQTASFGNFVTLGAAQYDYQVLTVGG